MPQRADLLRCQWRLGRAVGRVGARARRGRRGGRRDRRPRGARRRLRRADPAGHASTQRPGSRSRRCSTTGPVGATWSDRGTLIEQAWEEGIDTFDRPFLRPHPTLRWEWGPTGALVVNSVSPTTSCRTLISQVQLPGEGTSECAPGQPAAASTDLIQCTGQLRTVTAALLTARFPYVTPSGVVDCPGPDGVLPSGDDVATQIVDGGYAENTGVGTLLDLMPRILADVRHHNSCVLADDPRAGTCLGEPALRHPRRAAARLLRQRHRLGPGQQPARRDPRGAGPADHAPAGRGRPLLRACPARAGARDARHRPALVVLDRARHAPPAPAVDAWRGNQVAVVYQETKPGIAAPLGWVLSEGSIDAMDDALCKQDAGRGPRVRRVPWPHGPAGRHSGRRSRSTRPPGSAPSTTCWTCCRAGPGDATADVLEGQQEE